MDHTRHPDTPMTVAVAEAVSSFENCDPTALPPLHDTLDADALDTLFETGGDRSCTVFFAFSDSYVTIENGERIVVEAAETSQVSS
ncbi:HalOD1 output domain-containing protein [Haloarcula laminariae]|uniref:HalOD1 output domain-containing protein n=1 Tax=Haloarcula laminariae TaxID=2961577 RepID=UPI0021C8CE25|nr:MULTISPECIES: HalOD1 output domain-containing protein [Halomicroarcula]